MLLNESSNNKPKQMKIKILSIVSVVVLLTACAGDPNEWTEERKQIVKDKCDSEMFDCDCYLETTIKSFPDAQSYNSTLENEAENQEKVDAYWDKIYDGCMSE